MTEHFQKCWNTDRLQVRNLVKEDTPRLQEILTALYAKSNWGAVSLEEYQPDYFDCLLNRPELPPNGDLELVQNQVILKSEEQSCVGWMELYHGYPNEKTLWIGSLFFHPDGQGKNYGTEIIREVVNQAKQLNGYRSIQLGVYLRNWPALRFWKKVGFDKIVTYSGDKAFGLDKNCKVALELSLD